MAGGWAGGAARLVERVFAHRQLHHGWSSAIFTWIAVSPTCNVCQRSGVPQQVNCETCGDFRPTFDQLAMTGLTFGLEHHEVAASPSAMFPIGLNAIQPRRSASVRPDRPTPSR